MEEFRDLKGFDNYQISNLGRIYSKKRKVCLRVKRLGNSGYYQVRLSKNGEYVYRHLHRLLAETFLKNPNNYRTVNHINGNKLDNRLENLEWANDCRQQHQAYLLNLKHSTQHILTEDEILEVYKKYYEEHQSMYSLAKEYGTRKQQIAKLIKGQRHQNLYRQYREKAKI